MESTDDIEAGFHRARQLHAAGRYADAERAYQQLMTPGPHREPVLAALTELYIEAGRPNEALEALTKLTELLPDRFYYLAWLATLLDQWGQTDAAIDRYREFLRRHPDSPPAHFNLALLLKRNKEYGEALAEYERALDTGIEDASEVWSNMGVAYSDIRDADKAREMFEKALDIDSDYIPALFNLAGLHEETGERDRAITLYERIRDIDPMHFESLARLAGARRIESTDDPAFGALEEAIRQPQKDPVVHEALWFALGKAYDDCGRYEDATEAYGKANALGRQRCPKYDRVSDNKGVRRGQAAHRWRMDRVRRNGFQTHARVHLRHAALGFDIGRAAARGPPGHPAGRRAGHTALADIATAVTVSGPRGRGYPR
ncbi:MAG: tetratricopeptide repeat protein [Woeseiaceae bacterium]|nr:tetratricopeptide repeat protein [Woeseiaceae bacterium]